MPTDPPMLASHQSLSRICIIDSACHHHETACTYKYLQAPTSTYKYLQVPTSTYKYLQVPTSTYKYLQVPASTYKYLQVPTNYKIWALVFSKIEGTWESLGEHGAPLQKEPNRSQPIWLQRTSGDTNCKVSTQVYLKTKSTALGAHHRALNSLLMCSLSVLRIAALFSGLPVVSWCFGGAVVALGHCGYMNKSLQFVCASQTHHIL